MTLSSRIAKLSAAKEPATFDVSTDDARLQRCAEQLAETMEAGHLSAVLDFPDSPLAREFWRRAHLAAADLSIEAHDRRTGRTSPWIGWERGRGPRRPLALPPNVCEAIMAGAEKPILDNLECTACYYWLPVDMERCPLCGAATREFPVSLG